MFLFYDFSTPEGFFHIAPVPLWQKYWFTPSVKILEKSGNVRKFYSQISLFCDFRNVHRGGWYLWTCSLLYLLLSHLWIWDLVFLMNMFFFRGEPLAKFFRNAYFGFLFPMRGLAGAERSSFPRYLHLKFSILFLGHLEILNFLMMSGMLSYLCVVEWISNGMHTLWHS